MFKKCLLLLLFWGNLGAFAQIRPDSSASFKEKADYVLAPLIARGVSSGILLDRVFSSSGIAKWAVDSVPDTSSGSHFVQALFELEEARLIPDQSQPHYKLLPELGYQNQKGIVPLGVLRINVNAIDTNLP